MVEYILKKKKLKKVIKKDNKKYKNVKKTNISKNKIEKKKSINIESLKFSSQNSNKNNLTSDQLAELTNKMHNELDILEKKFMNKVTIPKVDQSKGSNSANGSSSNSRSSRGTSDQKISSKGSSKDRTSNDDVGSRRSSRTTKNSGVWKRLVENDDIDIDEYLPQKRLRHDHNSSQDHVPLIEEKPLKKTGSWADFDVPNSLASVGKVTSLDMLCAYSSGEMPLPSNGISNSNFTNVNTDKGGNSINGGHSVSDGYGSSSKYDENVNPPRQSVVDLINLGLPGSGTRVDARYSHNYNSSGPGSGERSSALTSPFKLARDSSFNSGSGSAEGDVGMDYDAPTPRSVSRSNSPRFGLGGNLSPRSPLPGVTPYDPSTDRNISNNVKDNINKFLAPSRTGSDHFIPRCKSSH